MNEKLEILNSKEDHLSIEQKRHLHFYSIKNFLLFFDYLKGTPERNIVFKLLSDYFFIIQEAEFNISKEDSKTLYFDYVMKIGKYYNFQLKFRLTSGLDGALLAGIVLDFILFLIGYLKKVYYIPICTFILIVYNRYNYFYYGKKNKLYGFGY